MRSPPADSLLLSDSPSIPLRPEDTLPLSELAVPNGRAVTTAMTLDDFASPDSSARDIVTLADSPSVQANIFYAVAAIDTVDISDDMSPDRSVVDIIAVADGTTLDSAVIDVVIVTEDVLFQSNIFYGILANDIVAISDVGTLFSSVVDTVAISDVTDIVQTIFYSIGTTDIVSIIDDVSPDIFMIDAVVIADDTSLDSVVIDIVAIAESAILQPNVFYAIVASDVVAIADIASLFSSVVDVVALSDTAELSPNIFYPVIANDIVAIAETVTLFSTVLDTVELVEAASIPLSSVTDVVDIVVSTSLIATKLISDQLGVDESFFDIAATFNRSFNEMLVLPDCIFTNESGQCTRVGLANIAIGDLLDLLFESNNSPVELIAVVDQPARNFTGGRGTAETMQAEDLRSMSVVSPAPNATLPVITTAMTETMELAGASDPKEAVQVGGTWEMDGFDNESLESLLVVMGMPIYNTSMTASSAGAGDMTMVLPTFLVDAEVGGEQPEGGAFLTPTVSEIPAGMQVMIPIDAAGSLNDDSPEALGNLTVSFTPAEDTGNFTMMVAMLEDNPEQIADALPRGIGAFFIDISFAGEFGASTPANSSYYESGGDPRLSFTLSEEWALENNLRRQGGIPVPILFLLNENTGEWEEIGDIDLPEAATDGAYTYTATLPHMSTYFIMGEPRRQGTSEPDVLLVDLAESLSIKSVAGTGRGVESSGRNVIKDLNESLGLSTSQPQPLHQRVLTVHNVTVAVSVADIHAAGIGTAVARLDFEITNRGSDEQEIVISYWYSSGEQRVYKGEQAVTIGGGESGIRSVEIPFGAAGVYEIMIEAMASDQTLASTDIVVEVPWLAANLFLFIIIAAAVVTASIAYVVHAMRTRLAASGR